MKTVLFAAAGTLCLAFAAHSAPANTPANSTRGHHLPVSIAADRTAAAEQQAGLTQPLPPLSPPAANCVVGPASITHTAYTTDDDADADSSAGAASCSQFLSTQMLVHAPSAGHT